MALRATFPTAASPVACAVCLLAVACTAPNPGYGEWGADGGGDRVLPPAVDAAPDASVGSDREARAPDAAPPGADVPVSRAGLVGHWAMDEGRGAVVSDLSGASNHGSLEGVAPTAAWTPGRRGTALEFPDTIGAAVEVPASPSTDAIRNGFTIAAWVYRSRAVAGERHTAILSRQLGTGNREIYTLAFHFEALIVWLYAPAPAPTISLAATTPAPVATWIHVAATWDGGTVRLYQDGAEVGQRPYTATLPPSPNPVVLGNNANATGLDQSLIGRLDEARLYDRALPREEILALIAATSP